MKFRHHTFEVIASICLRLKYEPFSDTKQHRISTVRSVCINTHLPDVLVEDMGAENVRVTRKVDMRRVILSRDIIVMTND